MPTLPRRNPNPGTGSREPLRSSLSDAAWAVEDRVVWGAADAFRRPFEWVVSAVEQWLVWPIQEEAALWSRPVRAAALAAAVLLAAVGIAAGVIVSDPSGDGGQSGPEILRVSSPGSPGVATTPSAKVAEATGGAVLQGSAPDFAEEGGGGVTRAEAATEPPGSALAAEATDVTGAAGTSADTAGKAGSEVAGPAAIAVARRFAGAFVLYETGHDTDAVKSIFHETATPDLAEALLERPPRLPANVKVPEAKVLNIVAGPQHGGTYTLSVSLLRVGVTSELRIDMQKTPAGDSSSETGGGSPESDKVRWLVTDVLG